MVQEFNETIGLEKGIIVEAFSQGNISDLTEKVVDAANKKVGRRIFLIFLPLMPIRLSGRSAGAGSGVRPVFDRGGAE